MHHNIQPIEKLEASNGSTVWVHSIFYTIQGEGPLCGTPAVFVRLAGCNLQCPGCDTDYTSKRKMMTPAQIVGRVKELMPFEGGLVVITGGEPFRQNIAPLCYALILGELYTVQIETNGTLPPPERFPPQVIIVCSPKAGKVHPEIARRATCFKYVLSHTSVAADGLPGLALGHSASPHVARPPDGFPYRIYLQPMDAQDPVDNQKNLNAVIKSCMEHGYILQLQIHKLLNLE